jgi:6-phosphogluconolactonase (cycloisomerase 2 family)
MDRRTFIGLLASSLAAPRTAWSQKTASKAFFYASLGPALRFYQIDIDGAALTPKGAVTLPVDVQYAWPHPLAPFLYAASSNGGSASLGISGDTHFLSALRIDGGTGALRLHGQSVALRFRPIHVTVDRNGAYALVVYNSPASVTVHRINEDGTLGYEIPQISPLDAGIFPHQIRLLPANDTAILVARGNDAAKGRPEDPGALKVLAFKDGQLSNRATVAPGGGYGFGPRHLDLHPDRPFVYVARERENKINVYRLANGTLDPQAVFEKDTLAQPGHIRSRQQASAVHVHPTGRYVYVANRAYDTIDFDGKKVFPGGENNIAVFSIDQATGEPTLVQNEDVRGIYPRTFALDPSGRVLIATNIEPKLVRDGTGLKTVPANFATFHVGPDGGLKFAHTYETDTRGALQFWSGIVAPGGS